MSICINGKIILAQKFLRRKNIWDSTQKERAAPLSRASFRPAPSAFDLRSEFLSQGRILFPVAVVPSYLKWTAVTRTILAEEEPVIVNTCESPPKVQCFARRRFNFLMVWRQFSSFRNSTKCRSLTFAQGSNVWHNRTLCWAMATVQAAADRDQPSLLLSYCDGEARSVLHLLRRRTW